MFLSDNTIKDYLKNQKIQITPEVKPSDIRPVGIRVHLADKILKAQPDQTLDLDNPTELGYETISLLPNGYAFKPGQFVLASTKEAIQTAPDLLTFIDGRSTIARLGLTIHVSSHAADGNHQEPRTITLEVKNLGDITIVLRANYPIGMVLFSQLTEPIGQSANNQYQSQTGAIQPNLAKEPKK